MVIDRTRRSVFSAFGLLTLGVIGGAVAEPKERVIKIVAKKFEFSPSEIRLRRGETVLLELSTQDVLMGFSIHDLGVRADIVPGKVTTLRLKPEKAGEFAFICDVFCGSGHEDMGGNLIVSA